MTDSSNVQDLCGGIGTVVTDDQVAALRAQLKGQGNEHRRLLNQLDPKAGNIGYTALVTGAFFEAVRRRFLKDGDPADDAEIIDFVTSVRLRLEEEGELDPNAAEIMIKVAQLDEFLRSARFFAEELRS